MNNLNQSVAHSTSPTSSAPKSSNILHLLALIVLLCAGISVKAQVTVLAAGDLLVTGYDASPAKGAPSAPYDRVSLVTLVQINAGTVIYITDRGYFGGGTWNTDNSDTEGTYAWTVGSNIAAGTEITLITDHLNKQALVGGSSNGTLAAVSANSIISLTDTGDQLIFFQGGDGDPANVGANFIAGVHWGYCPDGVTSSFTTDAGWDNIGTPGTCTPGEGSSNMPPGLVGGNSALWIGLHIPIAPLVDIGGYSKAQFNGSGSYDDAASLRLALMTKSNWLPIRLGVNTAINVPTGLLDGVLPVNQSGLSAKISGNIITVNWHTQSETNNKHFIVQTSSNGSSWKDVGTVASKANNGNSTVRLDYSFTGSIGGVAMAGLGLLGLLLLPAIRSRLMRLGLVVIALCFVMACNKNDGMDNDLNNTGRSGQSVYVRIAQVDINGQTSYSDAVVAKK